MADTPKLASNLSTDIETALHRMQALFTAISELAHEESGYDPYAQIRALADIGEALVIDQIADMRTGTAES